MFKKININLSKIYKQFTQLDYSKIDDFEVDGIIIGDYLDFCDAYIVSASYKGKPMTEAQLARLNEDYDYLYECIIKQIY